MKSEENGAKRVDVLLVEDSPSDVRLTQEAFRAVNGAINLHVATDGMEAMAFLNHEGAYVNAPRPDIILLDLKLPKMDGRQILTLIKDDERLKTIPTVILTASDAEADILKCHQLRANCFLTKPARQLDYESVLRSIIEFWLTRVHLPPH